MRGATLVVASLCACSTDLTHDGSTGLSPSPSEMASCAVADYSDRPVFASYWSPGTFDEADDQFVRDWYSTQLCAMGEPHLEAPPQGGVRVRFLWLRSFHPGVAVRIEHFRGRTRLVAITLDGAGGYAPGSVAHRAERVLPPDAWMEVEDAIADADFWQLPTADRSFGLDGAQWIIEIAESDRYHVVERWSAGELETLGRKLLDLTGLAPDPIY